jgi:two-component system osmolarity sensor histidine kinase EnvZ
MTHGTPSAADAPPAGKRRSGLALGLAQRTLLLLFVAVTGSLAVLAAGFALQREEDLTDFGDMQARSVAAQVHSIRLVLESVPPAYRRSVSESLKTSGTLNAFPDDGVRLPQAGTPESRGNLLDRIFGAARTDVPDISEAIARYSLPPVEVRYSADPDQPGYWVSQRIDGEKWWIVVLAGRPPPASRGVPWTAVAAVLLALVAIAALYAASITRPLRKLANATQRIGDSWPQPVVVDGPPELRELADSFNAMLVRLRQIENERHVLLGGLPHDLRAPLTRLRLRLATLTDLGEHPGIAEDIASIDHIVRQFTAFLRGVQPDEPLRPLPEVVDAAVTSYRNLGTDVAAEYPPDLDAKVPEFAIRRLLDNLIENARQHGRQPIRVRVQRGADGAIDLAVTDTGPGFPTEAAELAMEPFTKLDPARGRGGCGLGMAIVRQLARQLGGAVRFDRQPDSFSVIASIRVN